MEAEIFFHGSYIKNKYPFRSKGATVSGWILKNLFGSDPKYQKISKLL